MIQCLVVDDSQIACEAAAKILKDIGITPTEMLDSQEALEFCKKSMPDLIILDVMMPKMNGMAFLRELHRVVQSRKTYVIACSARDDIETVKDMKELGVNDYIVKPFPPELFISKVKNSKLI